MRLGFTLSRVSDVPKIPDAPESGPVEKDEPAAAVERDQPAGWKERFRRFENASPHEIAGALHDQKPDKLLSQAQVQKALDRYRDIAVSYELEDEQ